MKFFLIAICFAGFMSCDKEDDYVFLDHPRVQETYHRVFNVLSHLDREIDILWVIDNSGSMGDIQQNIVRNTALFMQAFKENTHIEWKMGVVSTDKDEAPFLGFDPAAPFDYRSIRPVYTFQRRVDSLGTRGSASEYVFHNVDRVISPMLQNPTENRTHFFRENAHLVVIMVTDEEEQSDEIDRHLYQAQSFYNHLRGLKGVDKIIRFYGAFSLKGMQSCSSREPYAGSPFEEIIDLTGGFAISACESNFGNRLADVGSDIASILKSPSIPINARPKIETLEVIFRGKKLPGGARSLGGVWYYNSAHSTINFYNLDFAEGDIDVADVEVRFDIDDGVDRSGE